MKMILKCPFDKKEIAKSNGARWDPNQKTWYFDGLTLPDDLRQFVDDDELAIYDANAPKSPVSEPLDDGIPW